MSFLRHPQIYPPIWSLICTGDGPLSGFAPGPHRLDESAAGYSLAGCAPAEPASASPDEYEYAVQSSYGSRSFHPTANSVLTVCVSPGGKRNVANQVRDCVYFRHCRSSRPGGRLSSVPIGGGARGVLGRQAAAGCGSTRTETRNAG